MSEIKTDRSPRKGADVSSGKDDAKKASKFSRVTDRRSAPRYTPRGRGSQPVPACRSFSNDFEWYNKNPLLLENSARISFGNPAGNGIRRSTWIGGTEATSSDSIHGIFTLKMLPTIGYAGDDTNALNAAAKSIYSWVRHANSGHANYDSPDLMVYLLAMRELYAYSGYLVKIYAAINSMNVQNRYLATGLLRSLYVDPVDILEHIPDLKFWINAFNKRANALSVPKALPMFEKAFKMYSGLYSDGKAKKDQFYQYVPSGFYCFNATKYTTGGCLEFKPLPNNLMSFQDLVTIGQSLLVPLLNEEDIGIMSGDIRKAFGENLYLLGDLPDTLLIEPIYDDFSVQTMHNASLVMVTQNTAGNAFDMIQLPDGTLSQYIGTCQYSSPATTTVLNCNRGTVAAFVDIDTEVPGIEEVTEAVTYTVLVKKSTALSAIDSAHAGVIAEVDSTFAIPASHEFISAPADYICVGCSAWRYVNESTMVETVISANYPSTSAPAYVLSLFEWHPFIALYASMGPSGYQFNGYLGNTHNYTTVFEETLRNIHTAQWLSMLAVPAVEHIK